MGRSSRREWQCCSHDCVSGTAAGKQEPGQQVAESQASVQAAGWRLRVPGGQNRGPLAPPLGQGQHHPATDPARLKVRVDVHLSDFHDVVKPVRGDCRSCAGRDTRPDHVVPPLSVHAAEAVRERDDSRRVSGADSQGAESRVAGVPFHDREPDGHFFRRCSHGRGVDRHEGVEGAEEVGSAEFTNANGFPHQVSVARQGAGRSEGACRIKTDTCRLTRCMACSHFLTSDASEAVGPEEVTWPRPGVCASFVGSKISLRG